jgi:hypothetical protein
MLNLKFFYPQSFYHPFPQAHPTETARTGTPHHQLPLLRQADAQRRSNRSIPPSAHPASSHPTGSRPPHPRLHEPTSTPATQTAKPTHHAGQAVHARHAENNLVSPRFAGPIRHSDRQTISSHDPIPTHRPKGPHQRGNQIRSKPHKHPPLRRNAQVTPPRACSATISFGVLRNQS